MFEQHSAKPLEASSRFVFFSYDTFTTQTKNLTPRIEHPITHTFLTYETLFPRCAHNQEHKTAVPQHKLSHIHTWRGAL